MPGECPIPLRVFFSYAVEDDAHRVQLEKHLSILKREGTVEWWHFRKIAGGEDWERAIQTELEAADVVLLLVSPGFVASDYCWNVEMQRALERHAAGEVEVLPVIVDTVEWSRAPFRHLQALPTGGRPVSAFENENDAWVQIVTALRRVAEGHTAKAGVHGVPTGVGTDPDPTRFLQALEEQHAYVDIRGMGARDAKRMALQQVYTRLMVVGGRHAPDAKTDGGFAGVGAVDPDDPAPERNGTQELKTVLAGHRNAALIGDPGSGKTTFLRYVALNLARAHLGRAEALRSVGLEEFIESPPFPVFVYLEKLAEFLSEHPDASLPDHSPSHVGRYLDFTLRGNRYGLPDDFLRQRVEQGNCFVLLDGLDEVPGERVRERMVQLIEQFVASDGQRNRYLVTCRTRAWQDRHRVAGSTTTFRLAPFRPEQIEWFADGWVRTLFQVGPDADVPLTAAARDYKTALLRAIYENPNGATMAQNPLMLTVLAVLHWNERRLPEQRTELYQQAVKYLLESRKALSTYEVNDRLECLQAVAMAMFEDHEGVQRSLDRIDAADAVRSVLECNRDAAMGFLDSEELNSGVLVCRAAGEVEFWHMTFQEYLAAVALANDHEGWWDRIADHLYDDRWNEVILLLAGCKRANGKRHARRMIERILETGTDRVSTAKAVGLVGRILRDVRTYGEDPAVGTGFSGMLEKTLAIFAPDGEPVAESVRGEVGDALGQAGDPRLSSEADNRVMIPGGAFPMGGQKENPDAVGFDRDAYGDERPIRTVSIPDLFIGRYPVTVGEFAEFVAAGSDGYLDPRVWSSGGWAWRDPDVLAPRDWDSQKAYPNRPVTGVSWFEADAYCRRAGGRLPTEAEWEWVARGSSARRFPWGIQDPDNARANYAGHVGHPTAVGIYPGGPTPEGVHDMAGNVWEWCSDWFHEYDPSDTVSPTGPKDGSSRVLRGGAFLNGPQFLRAAFRLNLHPDARYDYIGFRVVWVSAGEPD